MPIGEQLRQLAHNKPVMYGAVAAAALGGFVLWRRKKSTGSASSDAGAAAAGGTYLGTPTMDTTGTDVANWLSNYDQNVAAELQGFSNQLSDTLKALQNTPTGQQGGAPPATGATPPAIVPAPPGNPIPQQVTVAKYTRNSPVWNSTLSGIASHYHTSVAALLKLNPGIKNPNVIYPGQQIRVA
jgi:LysM repeat protein